jgi:RNA polymerase sigma-70 factor (ECF subfamily)
MASSDDGAFVRDAVGRFEGPLVRYAARLLGDVERARDVVQETFLRLCEADPASVEGRLAEWLYTVCRNRALDVRRKESRMAPSRDAELDALASRDPDPAAAVETLDAARRVVRLLESIPANQQECIRLRFQGGLSYDEISRVTGLTVSHVGVLIHLGMKSLRSRIAAPPRPAFGLERSEP